MLTVWMCMGGEFGGRKGGGCVGRTLLTLSHTHTHRTPLMLAVTNGHTDVAQVLVEHGAHVDCTDKHLHTALHRAVSQSGVFLLHDT